MIIINVYIIILFNKLIPLNVFAICAIHCVFVGVSLICFAMTI